VRGDRDKIQPSRVLREDPRLVKFAWHQPDIPTPPGTPTTERSREIQAIEGKRWCYILIRHLILRSSVCYRPIPCPASPPGLHFSRHPPSPPDLGSMPSCPETHRTVYLNRTFPSSTEVYHPR
jgi:hypothetical protein